MILFVLLVINKTGGKMINHFDMELTQKQVKKYKKGGKKEKGEIITRYCELTGISRNLASKRFLKTARDIKPRVLNTKRNSGKKKTGRKKKYGSIHISIVKKAWELSGEICAERLDSVLSEFINQLENENQLRYYGKRYIEESKHISLGTLKNIIYCFPKASWKKKRKGKSDLYKQIPIHAYFGENSNKPGYIEIDYVEHSGGNASERFGITGCYVCVFSQWIARGGEVLRLVSSQLETTGFTLEVHPVVANWMQPGHYRNRLSISPTASASRSHRSSRRRMRRRSRSVLSDCPAR